MRVEEQFGHLPPALEWGTQAQVSTRQSEAPTHVLGEKSELAGPELTGPLPLSLRASLRLQHTSFQ